MDFEKLLKELKLALTELFGEKWGDLKHVAKKDINQFLNDSKYKLKKWTELLEKGQIDIEDYQWLIKSQKDLMLMEALKSAGVNKIRLGHFKNKVIKTIVDIVKLFIPNIN